MILKHFYDVDQKPCACWSKTQLMFSKDPFWYSLSTLLMFLKDVAEISKWACLKWPTSALPCITVTQSAAEIVIQFSRIEQFLRTVSATWWHISLTCEKSFEYVLLTLVFVALEKTVRRADCENLIMNTPFSVLYQRTKGVTSPWLTLLHGNSHLPCTVGLFLGGIVVSMWNDMAIVQYLICFFASFWQNRGKTYLWKTCNSEKICCFFCCFFYICLCVCVWERERERDMAQLFCCCYLFITILLLKNWVGWKWC